MNDIAKDLGASLPKQDEIDEAMKIIDANKDGKINFLEYKVRNLKYQFFLEICVNSVKGIK